MAFKFRETLAVSKIIIINYNNEEGRQRALKDATEHGVNYLAGTKDYDKSDGYMISNTNESSIIIVESKGITSNG